MALNSLSSNPPSRNPSTDVGPDPGASKSMFGYGLAAPWLTSTIVHVALLLTLAPWCMRIADRTIGDGFHGVSVVASVDGIGLGNSDGPGDDNDDGDGAGEAAGATAEPSASDNQSSTSAALANVSPTMSIDLPASISESSIVDAASLSRSDLVVRAGDGARAPSVADILAGLDGNGAAAADAAGSGAGGQRGGSRPGGARTGVFGISSQGHKFVYVFDRSSSMAAHDGAPLAAAKEQLLSSLNDLGSVHQFQIIFYNERPQVFSPSGASGKLVFANEQSKRLAADFVRGVAADGGTQHEDALALALRMAPDVIFFLTDADEPRMTERQMERIQRLNRGATVHTIEFGYGPKSEPENFLAQIARQNGGEYVYINIADLPNQRANVKQAREKQAIR